MRADAAFALLVTTLAAEPGITFGEGRGFGSRALKANGKIFAMLARHDKLVMKLPKTKVAAMVEAGIGHMFMPGHGRPVAQWIEFDIIPANVLDLSREAAAYVSA